MLKLKSGALTALLLMGIGTVAIYRTLLPAPAETLRAVLDAETLLTDMGEMLSELDPGDPEAIARPGATRWFGMGWIGRAARFPAAYTWLVWPAGRQR